MLKTEALKLIRSSDDNQTEVLIALDNINLSFFVYICTCVFLLLKPRFDYLSVHYDLKTSTIL